jgi:hypothetical protein
MGLFSTTRQAAGVSDIHNQLQVRQVKMVRHRVGSLLSIEKVRVNQT